MYISFKNFGSIEEAGASSWDAEKLAGEVERRAAILSAMGIGRLSRVAIAHGNSVHFFADLFAVWRVGAAASCLDGSLTTTELKTIVSFVKPAAMLIDLLEAPVDIGIPVLKLADMTSPSAAALPKDGELDDPALILFTSGTTGVPKGVVLSFRAILARVSLNAAAIGKTALARTLVTLPTHFGHGLIGNSLTPMIAGSDILLHPPGIQLAQNLGRIIDEYRISFLSSVPTLWRMALKLSAPPSDNSLKRVHVGSAPLSVQLWKEIADWSRADVVNCYGITETANWIAGASSQAEGFIEGLIGRPWGGTAAIRNEGGELTTIGEGEIVVQTPTLMSGYLDRPDLSANALTDGWYRTGDVGRVDEQGRILLTGRIKDEINRAGIKVQPAEIDALLESHPAIAEACVFGMTDEVSGEIVAAAIKLEVGATETEEGLQGWCRERLRRVSIPDRWFFVDDIPRNARGKVSREAVRRALVKEEVSPRGNMSPATNASGSSDDTVSERVRCTVEKAWSQVLNRRTFGANLSWDEAGGDSLKALHLWFLIENGLGFRPPLEALDGHTTPTDLIIALESHQTASDVRASDDGHSVTPLVYFMPPAEGDASMYARFRAAFKGQLKFQVIDYPTWDEMIEFGANFDMMVDAAVSQIRASSSDDGCLLVGYSFGGFVAWETARRLLQTGGRVGFLGLIDTQLEDPKERHRSVLARTVRAIGMLGSKYGRSKLGNFILYLLLNFLVERRAFHLLKAINYSAGLLPTSAEFIFRLRLIQHLRTVALKRISIKPLELSATLFRSEHFRPEKPDYGWGSLCGQLITIPIGGDHSSITDAKHNEVLNTRFLEVIQSAATSASPAKREPIVVSSNMRS